jgi:hypothetical protein
MRRQDAARVQFRSSHRDFAATECRVSNETIYSAGNANMLLFHIEMCSPDLIVEFSFGRNRAPAPSGIAIRNGWCCYARSINPRPKIKTFTLFVTITPRISIRK